MDFFTYLCSTIKNKKIMKKTIYNNIIILENDGYALVMPKYSPDGFINYYN